MGYIDKELCSYCGNNPIDTSKQTFSYRDREGNRWNSCVKPLCDECISELSYQNEKNIKQAYVSTYVEPQYRGRQCPKCYAGAKKIELYAKAIPWGPDEQVECKKCGWIGDKSDLL